MTERVDLNVARMREVAAVPGVGPLQARSIVLDRRLYGRFQSIEDVRRVPGVSVKLVKLLAGRFKVDPPEREIPVVIHFDGKEPIYFAGPPSAVRGEFVVRNDGDASVCAVALQVESGKLRTDEGVPLARVALGLPLGAGERRRVALKLRLDPSTPPDTYHATFVGGTGRHPVTILVSEHFATRFSPPAIMLPTVAGKYERQVVVRNYGNVPIIIKDIGAVQLEDKALQCRVIRETIRNTSEKSTLDQLVGTAVNELKKDFALIPPLRLRAKNRPVHIEPGADGLLILEVNVPMKLPRGRDFRASAVVYDTRLRLQLVEGLAPVRA
jgi:competence ComEA-like helix-hairpin-helix protein